jgi:hypothetical protein
MADLSNAGLTHPASGAATQSQAISKQGSVLLDTEGTPDASHKTALCARLPSDAKPATRCKCP